MATAISFHHENDQYLERFSLIWLNSNSQDTQDIEQKLRPIFNDFTQFTDLEQCEQYIQQTSSTDRLVLIIGSKLERQCIYSTHQLKQILSIYIYRTDTDTIEQQFSKYPKVKCFLRNKIVRYRV